MSYNIQSGAGRVEPHRSSLHAVYDTVYIRKDNGLGWGEGVLAHNFFSKLSRVY